MLVVIKSDEWGKAQKRPRPSFENWDENLKFKWKHSSYGLKFCYGVPVHLKLITAIRIRRNSSVEFWLDHLVSPRPTTPPSPSVPLWWHFKKVLITIKTSVIKQFLAFYSSKSWKPKSVKTMQTNFSNQSSESKFKGQSTWRRFWRVHNQKLFSFHRLFIQIKSN